MENKEVDYITFKTYEAAMNQIISWAENCKRTIGDFAGVLILPSQCNTAPLYNYNQLLHPKHGNGHCFSV